MASSSIGYQLKLTVKEIEPEIWRRILVHPAVSLHQLHKVIQKLMGWVDYHLYQYTINGERYAPPYADEDYEDKPAKSVKYPLSWVVLTQGVKDFTYEYDFGDGWQIDVQVEAVLDNQDFDRVALCTGGERAGPLEDSGGPPGYMEKVEILKDPNHEEYRELKSWADSMASMSRRSHIEFDPERFDIEATNKVLARLKGHK